MKPVKLCKLCILLREILNMMGKSWIWCRCYVCTVQGQWWATKGRLRSQKWMNFRKISKWGIQNRGNFKMVIFGFYSFAKIKILRGFSKMWLSDKVSYWALLVIVIIFDCHYLLSSSSPSSRSSIMIIIIITSVIMIIISHHHYHDYHQHYHHHYQHVNQLIWVSKIRIDNCFEKSGSLRLKHWQHYGWHKLYEL